MHTLIKSLICKTYCEIYSAYIYITGQNTYNLIWFEKRGLWVLNIIQFAMCIALHWISSLARAFQGVCIIDGKHGDWKIYMNIYIITQRLHAIQNCFQKFLSTWFGTIYIWYVCDFYIQYWRQYIYILMYIYTYNTKTVVHVIVTIIVIMMITSDVLIRTHLTTRFTVESCYNTINDRTISYSHK